MSANIVTLPNIKRPPDGRVVVRIELTPEDTQHLDVFANLIGFNREDAAGRALRAFLRLRVPHDVGEGR